MTNSITKELDELIKIISKLTFLSAISFVKVINVLYLSNALSNCETFS